MANTYYTLLTTIGQASIANAIALNQTVSLTHMAVGDGNGVPTVPKESQTELVNEVYRAQINQLTTDLDNPNYLIAEMIVPTNIGGWSVREVGLFDEEGYLIAIANFPETYKPKLEEGSGRDLVIRIILQVSNTDVVTLKVDPTVILASQAWVIDNFSKSKLFPGGAKDQVLTKLSDNSGDMGWKYPSGVPIGTVEYFAMATPPAGYLKADGAAVGRDTYPDLYAAIGTTYGEGDGTSTFNLPGLNREIGTIVPFASLHMPQDFMLCDGRAVSRAEYAELFAIIGTTYGEGDGETTFNLPDMIGRFAEGSATPGQKIAAGLPNITGAITNVASGGTSETNATGALSVTKRDYNNKQALSTTIGHTFQIGLNASSSNPIYGASNTVQPPAVTVCYGIRAKNRLHAAIKAFDAAVNQGLIDVTELANEVTGKADKTQVPNLAMPIGAIYIQYANQTDPTTLFGGEWENISARFAGQFFRAEGGNAAAFGEAQGGGAPNITGTISGNDSFSDIADITLSQLSGAFYGTEMYLPISVNGTDKGAVLRTLSIAASRSNAAYNANEFRPYNSTIRVWKRTA